MAALDYLAVLISIIIGLAITQVLTGYRGLALARRRVRLYWPALIWTVVILAIAVQSWWAMFGLRALQTWSFGDFAIVLLQSGVLYMLAGLSLPDFGGDEPVDLKTHYFDHRRLFFAGVILLLLISLAKDLVIAGALPSPPNVAFQVLLAAGAAVAIATTREGWHRLFAPAALVAVGAYIGVLFARLP